MGYYIRILGKNLDNIPISERMKDNPLTRAWGYSSLALTLAVWILSLPKLGIVTDLLGYTPRWMFAMLLAGCLAGVIASLRDRGWWLAVAVGGFTMLLMVWFNNM
jgi:hypothetical protein